MASIKIDQQSAQAHPPSIQVEETYHGAFASTAPIPIKLRIATGGAGQSGLLRALSNAFIDDLAEREKCEPFGVAWLKSDTTGSFNYLGENAADLSITYHAAAEDIAIKQGIADRREYAWRDHWLLVGPKTNPANLPLPLPLPTNQPPQTIFTLFSQFFLAAVSSPSPSTSSSPPPIRFLSRHDKSACNIKESSIWTSLGQVPWAEPVSDWYHTYTSFPFAALEAAARLGEYTLTDRVTWLASRKEVREGMVVFLEGTDNDDETNHILLNPAHLLICRYGLNKDTANKFADWMGRRDGGQEVVRRFEVDGRRLYSMVPGMVE